MPFKEKYPWSTLENPGDTFEILPEWDIDRLKRAIYIQNQRKKGKQKYKLLVDLNQVIRTK